MNMSLKDHGPNDKGSGTRLPSLFVSSQKVCKRDTLGTGCLHSVCMLVAWGLLSSFKFVYLVKTES